MSSGDNLFLSPVRQTQFTYYTCSPFMNSGCVNGSWDKTPGNRHRNHSVDILSPSSARSSPDSPMSMPFGSPDSGNDFMKRGRPKATVVTTLIQQGNQTESSIQCKMCSRVFPREKSLQAHMRTHTGERPYICDFPECNKAFCQSGQLKTHQRLHTGEKPFVCSAEKCQTRFTHANRHCPDHPTLALTRDEDNMPIPALDEVHTTPIIKSWLNRYIIQRQERTPYKLRSPLQQPGTKRSLYQDLEKASMGHFHPSEEFESKRETIENQDPVTKLDDEEAQNNLSEFGLHPLGPIPVSVIKRVESLPYTYDDQHDDPFRTPKKRIRLGDVHNLVVKGSPRKEAEKQARINGALALIELANGSCV